MWRTHSCVPCSHSCEHETFLNFAHYSCMDSHRRLPHVYPENAWLFVTWHLYGSLPSARFPPPHKASAGEAFVWMDRYSDVARAGPLFLKQEPVAQLVVHSLFKGAELGHYKLAAFVVMANHVHVLLLPLVAPSILLKSLKGYTAREANRLLGRTGEPFWQRESYDHWVRNADEFRKITAYIENNPVKAGIAVRAEDYAWSSANAEWRERLCSHECEHGTPGACATGNKPLQSDGINPPKHTNPMNNGNLRL